MIMEPADEGADDTDVYGNVNDVDVDDFDEHRAMIPCKFPRCDAMYVNDEEGHEGADCSRFFRCRYSICDRHGDAGDQHFREHEAKCMTKTLNSRSFLPSNAPMQKRESKYRKKHDMQ